MKNWYPSQWKNSSWLELQTNRKVYKLNFPSSRLTITKWSDQEIQLLIKKFNKPNSLWSLTQSRGFYKQLLILYRDHRNNQSIKLNSQTLLPAMGNSLMAGVGVGEMQNTKLVESKMNIWETESHYSSITSLESPLGSNKRCVEAQTAPKMLSSSKRGCLALIGKYIIHLGGRSLRVFKDNFQNMVRSWLSYRYKK